MAEDADDVAAAETLNWPDIHEALRAALQRLAYAAQGAAKLPPGCTFTLALELRDEAEAPIGVSRLTSKNKKGRAEIQKEGRLTLCSIPSHGSLPRPLCSFRPRRSRTRANLCEELRQSPFDQ